MIRFRRPDRYYFYKKKKIDLRILKIILLHGRILRGFQFGNDIMPARSAAIDLYRVSLPPRHRADSCLHVTADAEMRRRMKH